VPADSAALSALAYRSKRSNGYDDTTMARMTGALEFTPARLSKHRFWVAADRAQIIGCIALAPLDNTTAAVRSFFIAPEYKGRGIGTLLWQSLFTIAQSQGVIQLVAEADPASLAFYENLGFVTQKLVPSRHIPGEMVPIMARDI
jgi:ribosomal protein S18 acetylase RimI-like enzyme